MQAKSLRAADCCNERLFSLVRHFLVALIAMHFVTVGCASAQSPEGGRFASGEDALLMVRPEDLALDAKEPDASSISLPVTCTDLVYQGAVVRCALADCAGNELVAHLGPHDATPEVRPGASLWLRWRSESARLLHRDDG